MTIMVIRKTSWVIAGFVTIGLSGISFAQVGGGNELPSSATTSAGGTANTPRNNGAGANGSSMGGGSGMSSGSMAHGSTGSMGSGSMGAGTSGSGAGGMGMGK